MRKVGILAIGIVAFVTTMPAVPRYSAPVTQVSDSPAIRSDEAATQKPSAPVLQRIKQEAQSCKTVVVKLMQRPLDMDFLKDSVGGVARKATGGTAAHVQVVAIDKSTDRVIDNFGVTGDFGGGGKARIFSEKNLDKYDSEPCGTYEMSIDDYYVARDRTIAQVEGGAIYEPYNGVGLVNHIKEGIKSKVEGTPNYHGMPGDIVANVIAGAASGAKSANDTYDKSNRHDYGVHSDSVAKMSFPVINCQAGGDLFVKNLEGLPTVGTVKQYIQPGEKDAQFDVCRDMAMCIDTSKLEELLKEGILFLKGLIAKGKRATNSQIDAHNQRVKEMLAETVSIVKRIDSLGISDEEKKSIAEKVFESVKGLNSQFDSLNKKARSMGLVRGATTEEQIELITDVQGKADVVSVDLSKSETESIKSKSNDVSYNPDFDVCKCAVPDDRDFRCKKCGKMSKCLAPYRDKEFERMLNNRK